MRIKKSGIVNRDIKVIINNPYPYNEASNKILTPWNVEIHPIFLDHYNLIKTYDRGYSIDTVIPLSGKYNTDNLKKLL